MKYGIRTMFAVDCKKSLQRSIFETMKLPDLNELYYFAQVVEHGGFAAAETQKIASAESGIKLLKNTI